MRAYAYWISTALISFAMASGGIAYLAHAGFAAPGVEALGYPAYFLTILGGWKVLGGAAIALPGMPRVKEWAYAGIAFDLSGAALSHLAVGSPLKVIAPVVLLGIMTLSWALRPSDRRLGTPAIA
jgi:hypothetical protein